MTSTPRHVIFGTGAIGLATLDALLRRGETVRMVNRSGSAPVPDEVEVVGGDAADPQFTIEVTRDARVVYQTLNPPYERWVEEFPALQAGVLAAAEAQGPVGQHGERLHVRASGGPPADRDPRLRRAHQEGKAPRPDGHRAARRPPGRAGCGRHRTRLRLLRTRRRRPVQPRRPAVPRRPGRKDRHRPRRPRPAAHLHLHPRHRRRPRRSRRAPERLARCGICPTTPTPTPPGSWSILSFSRQASRAPGSARSSPG